MGATAARHAHPLPLKVAVEHPGLNVEYAPLTLLEHEVEDAESVIFEVRVLRRFVLTAVHNPRRSRGGRPLSVAPSS